MELDIRKLDELWTADNKKLGLAQQLFHRLADINPNLQLYASYLEVKDFDYGEVFYVPTDFITGRDVETGRLTLDVTYNDVMKRTWFRMPEFVVRGQGRKETLLSP